MSEPQPQFRVVEVDDGTGGGGGTPRSGRYARGHEPKAEVRRCGRCGKATLVCCQAWQHAMNGHATGTVTRQCRCQACGADVTLRDPITIRTTRVLGFVFLVGVVPGLVCLALARRWARAWDESPLVPDAPFPAIRTWRGPGNRRCGACGQIARLVDITRHRYNGVPIGTDCQHRCDGCGRAFRTESVGGVLFGVFFGALIALLGTAWALHIPPHKDWQWLVAPPIALLGAFTVLRALRSVGAAIANPRLEGAEAAP